MSTCEHNIPIIYEFTKQRIQGELYISRIFHNYVLCKQKLPIQSLHKLEIQGTELLNETSLQIKLMKEKDILVACKTICVQLLTQQPEHRNDFLGNVQLAPLNILSVISPITVKQMIHELYMYAISDIDLGKEKNREVLTLFAC